MKYLLLSVILAYNALGSETRIKVGIADTGVPFDKTFTEWLCQDNRTDTPDKESHASEITYILTSEGLDPKTHCILYAKIDFFNEKKSPDYSLSNEINNALIFLREHNVSYINMSYGGKGAVKGEAHIIRSLLEEHVKMYVASGNDGKNLDEECFYYPACYTEFTTNEYWKVVGSTYSSSNKGKVVKEYADDRVCYNNHCSRGTSFASPRVMLRDILNDSRTNKTISN